MSRHHGNGCYSSVGIREPFHLTADFALFPAIGYNFVNGMVHCGEIFCAAASAWKEPFDDNPDHSTNSNIPQILMAIQGEFLGATHENGEEAAGSAFHGVDLGNHFRTRDCK